MDQYVFTENGDILIEKLDNLVETTEKVDDEAPEIINTKQKKRRKESDATPEKRGQEKATSGPTRDPGTTEGDCMGILYTASGHGNECSRQCRRP